MKEESMRIDEIRGIEDTVVEKLSSLGIKTAEDLLAAGKTPTARKDLAAKIGLEPKDLLEMCNRADLARIKGIGEVYSDLLEKSGVDTVLELSKRVPANLIAKLVEEAKKGDVRRIPTLAEVEDWVSQAKALGRGIEY